MLVKEIVKTLYWNPQLKEWQTESETPYLKSNFKGWA